MDDVVEDGPMDHLSISLAPFSSIKSSSKVWVGCGVRKWVAVVGEEREGKGLSRVCTVPTYLQPREETGRGGGWTEGWIGMPVEKKKKIFYSSRTVVAGGLPLTVDLCVFFQWTAVHWTCFWCKAAATGAYRPITGYISQSDTERNSSVRTLYSSDTAVLLMK